MVILQAPRPYSAFLGLPATVRQAWRRYAQIQLQRAESNVTMARLESVAAGARAEAVEARAWAERAYVEGWDTLARWEARAQECEFCARRIEALATMEF